VGGYWEDFNHPFLGKRSLKQTRGPPVRIDDKKKGLVLTEGKIERVPTGSFKEREKVDENLPRREGKRTRKKYRGKTISKTHLIKS